MRGLLLLILLYPFAEIATLVAMADAWGGGVTMLWVVMSAIIGIAMLRNQQLGALLTLGSLMRQGDRVSLYSLLWPLRYLLAGVLFLIPGVISDVLALLLLLPLQGPTIKRPATPPQAADNVIDGEYTRVDEPVDRSRHLD
ncbi:FxsA family protein [Pseudogulbenkiania sp. MAI-1]|uniref:FxsA family protein n=1 Tax=Pseudogulbenkiania sp. MAI-1 TaxID=990370 RepID=UPI00045E9335|nr:FxsA family protein [Pseudogulbenkiania sp. MAI-1]